MAEQTPFTFSLEFDGATTLRFMDAWMLAMPSTANFEDHRGRMVVLQGRVDSRDELSEGASQFIESVYQFPVTFPGFGFNADSEVVFQPIPSGHLRLLHLGLSVVPYQNDIFEKYKLDNWDPCIAFPHSSFDSRGIIDNYVNLFPISGTATRVRLNTCGHDELFNLTPR